MRKCIIYIDESGTINFDNEKFIISCLTINDSEHEKILSTIKKDFYKLHEDLDRPLQKEIKGTSLKKHPVIWEAFMQKISTYNLDLRAVVVDELHFQKYAPVIDTGYAKNSYYDFLVGKLIRSIVESNKDLIDIQIFIDNHGSSDIALREYLYNEFVIKELIDNDDPKFINITTTSVNSDSNCAIQLIDIIVHSLFAHYNHNNNIGYNKIKKSFKEFIFIPSKKISEKL